MGATLDLNIVSKKFISIKEIINLFNDTFNVIVKLENIDIVDDWEYSDVISISKIDEIFNYIEDNKIADIELIISNKWKAGCQVEKIDNNYLTTLWLNTINLQYLDCDIVNEENKLFYDTLINVILKSLNNYDISISAIGVETIFEYNNDIHEMINACENVTTWIINNQTLKSMDKYQIEEYADFVAVVYKRVK